MDYSKAILIYKDFCTEMYMIKVLKTKKHRIKTFIYPIYIPNIGDIYGTGNDKHFKTGQSDVEYS